jgi:hypothetical protein
MRRVFGEWLLSAGAVAFLLLALLVIYDPIREDASRRVLKPTAELSGAAQGVRTRAVAMAALARETTRSHTELVVFGIAAAVLFGFMLRT